MKPTMEIETVAIEALTLDPDNARTHSPSSVRSIAASLEAFGQASPIVALRETKVVVAGNGTLMAARELGWETVEVKWSDMSPEAAMSYAIADNRTAELAFWNDATLERALTAAKEHGALEATGFDEVYLERLQRTFVDDSENAAQGVSVEERPEAPRPGLRSLVVPLSASEYEIVSEWLDTKADEHGTMTAAETLMAVLEVKA